MAKDKDYQKMIHTSRWMRLRRDKLSDYPLCERCEEEGRHSLAVEVHHVIPVEDGLTRQEKERLMFDYHNLRALCHDCHVKTHMEMGRSGKAYAERKRKNGIRRFIDRFINN
jgi:5-methylcytosine-specific restriction endonuclease McrA